MVRLKQMYLHQEFPLNINFNLNNDEYEII